jgi:hypothetical protein
MLANEAFLPMISSKLPHIIAQANHSLHAK